MKQRLLRLLVGCAVLLGAGLAYAVFAASTGLFIPCLFRKLTGFLCPGCGVSHMCLALLRLDFPGAWRANAGLLPLLPFLGLLAVRIAVRRVRHGHTQLLLWERILTYAMLVWLLLWAVLRNLP